MTKISSSPLKRADNNPRHRLIEAAYRVIGEQGLEAATVKQIATVADANPGLVHYYFGGKDGLLLAMVEHSAAILAGQFDQLLEADDTADLSELALATSIAILRSDPDRSRLQAELLALGLRRPDLYPGVASLVADATERTAKLVAAARGRKSVTADDRSTAAVLRSAFDGLAMQLAYDPTFDLESAVAALRRII